MIKTYSRVTLVFFLLASFPLAVSLARQQSDTSTDSAAIKQAVALYSDALNRHDARATAMMFSEDADFRDSAGTSFHGRKGIEEGFTSLFAGRLKTAQRKDSVRSIRFLTPQIAAVDNDWEVTGLKAPDGSDLPPSRGIHAWIMTKQNGHWLITVFHGQTNMS